MLHFIYLFNKTIFFYVIINNIKKMVINKTIPFICGVLMTINFLIFWAVPIAGILSSLLLLEIIITINIIIIMDNNY